MKNRKYKFEYTLSHLCQFMMAYRFNKFKRGNIFKIDTGVCGF